MKGKVRKTNLNLVIFLLLLNFIIIHWYLLLRIMGKFYDGINYQTPGTP
jgi:hypothetical protein